MRLGKCRHSMPRTTLVDNHAFIEVVDASLGLWIVRRLLSELGGSISLRSALGEGATFTVKIPKETT